MDGFSLLPFNCFLLRSSCEGCRVFPAQLLRSHTHRHAHDDGPVRLACCTHEEGPRRVGVRRGPVGRSTHFFPSCFVFFAARAGRHPRRHTHTHAATPCRSSKESFVLCVFISRAGISFGAGLVSISFPDVSFSFAALTLPMEGRECRHVFLASLAPTHKKSDCALRAALTRR
ncbi:hypothetical protein BCY84_05080 [Trypanosoma cruzi cruzi]|nr:hypothetical protein BCY84_05080 [Trypanosoma cruzi cruzi]